MKNITIVKYVQFIDSLFKTFARAQLYKWLPQKQLFFLHWLCFLAASVFKMLHVYYWLLTLVIQGIVNKHTYC